MTEKELKKQYFEEWKKKEPTKYIAWLIFYYGSLIPLLFGVVQVIGKLNDQKIATALAFWGAFLVMEIIAMFLGLDQKKGYKAYRKAHEDLLKK